MPRPRLYDSDLAEHLTFRAGPGTRSALRTLAAAYTTTPSALLRRMLTAGWPVVIEEEQDKARQSLGVDCLHESVTWTGRTDAQGHPLGVCVDCGQRLVQDRHGEWLDYPASIE